jgi:subtilisin family serine protease
MSETAVGRPAFEPGGENGQLPPPLFYRPGELLTVERYRDDVARLVARLDDPGGNEQSPKYDFRNQRPARSAKLRNTDVVRFQVRSDPLALAREMKRLALDPREEIPDGLVVGPHWVFTLAPSPLIGPGSDPFPAQPLDVAEYVKWYKASCKTYRFGVAVVDTGMWKKPASRIQNVSVAAADQEIVDVDPSDGVVDAYHTGHGGFIAGVIEAHAPGVKIVAKNAFVDGELTEERVVRKVDEALRSAKLPIAVLNLSLGGYADELGETDFVLLTDAVERWVRHGALVVAAAGNDGRSDPWYPAGFSRRFPDNVVSVGALECVKLGGTPLWRPAEFSNHGDWVTAWAPGVGLQSEYPMGLAFEYLDPAGNVADVAKFDDGRAVWDGTSFATPYVAAEIIRHARSKNMKPVSAWKDLRGSRPFVVLGTDHEDLCG